MTIVIVSVIGVCVIIGTIGSISISISVSISITIINMNSMINV